MDGVLTVLIILAALATLGVLAAGVFNMFRQNHDPRTSNVLMRWRVILQAVAILLIVVFLVLHGR